MTEGRVEPASRGGAWESRGNFGPWARWCLKRAELVRADYAARVEEARRNNLKALPPGVVDLGDEAALLADATIVFAGMAVEGFLNFYGVLRLGEQFFTQYYERLGVAPKLAALVATCTGTLLDSQSEIMKVAVSLAERRNALVHPKTRELDPATLISSGQKPSIVAAQAAIADMDRFFQLLMGYDEALKSWIPMLTSSSLTSA